MFCELASSTLVPFSSSLTRLPSSDRSSKTTEVWPLITSFCRYPSGKVLSTTVTWYVTIAEPFKFVAVLSLKAWQNLPELFDVLALWGYRQLHPLDFSPLRHASTGTSLQKCRTHHLIYIPFPAYIRTRLKIPISIFWSKVELPPNSISNAFAIPCESVLLHNVKNSFWDNYQFEASPHISASISFHREIN